MALLIDKKNAKDLKRILNSELKKEPKKGNLSKHFGKLKRAIDGLKYQMEIRKNED